MRLALRAQIVETKTQSVLATRSFELFETAPTDDPYGGVLAANQMTAKLITEMVEWLDTVIDNGSNRSNDEVQNKNVYTVHLFRELP